MTIRLRGNTKHTQKNGFEPGEITVEVSVDREEDYCPGTITEYTLRVHQELAEACDEMNGAVTAATKKHPFDLASSHT